MRLSGVGSRNEKACPGMAPLLVENSSSTTANKTSIDVGKQLLQIL